MNDHALGGGYTDGDVDTNGSDNQDLWSLVEQRYSRRQTMRGLAAATMAVFATPLLSACGDDDDPPATDLDVTAGADGQTRSGKAVRLIGSTPADTVVIGWEQVSGPPVTLDNAGTAQASFIAPAVAAATPLVFRFSARQNGLGGSAASAQTTVTVNPAALDFTAVPKSLADLVAVPAG